MAKIGEWTITIRTQSKSGNPNDGQNLEVLKLIEAFAYNLPVDHSYKVLGTNEDGSYKVNDGVHSNTN
jgi:hypothetical protein